MLDVVLYGYDGRGRLTLQEKSFANLNDLARYFDSPNGARWKWAEVDISTDPDQPQIVHYSASALRGMVVASCRVPSYN
jgi:hypothetical protein